MKNKKEFTLQIGDRVKVDLTEVPKKERQCEIGEITKIWIRFRRTPELREINFTVTFDENYIKKRYRLVSGISSFNFNVTNMKYPRFITKII